MANKKFYVDIDLQNNKLDNATIGTNSQIASLAGSFQYDAGSNRLQYNDGSIVQDVANLNDISSIIGALVFQGSIDCSTVPPAPDVTTDPLVLQGQFWIVTVAGTFLGEDVQVGDLLIANTNNPGATLANWTIVQGNVVIATESVAGITYLASSAQVATGTENGAYAVNPLKLQEKVDSLSNVLTLAVASWAGVGPYTYTATHNLAADGVVVSFIDSVTKETVEFAYVVTDNNTVTVSSNTIPANDIIASFVKATA